MAAFFHWLGILIGAVVFGVVAHLVVLVLKKVAPPAAQGLYRATLIPAAPFDWVPSVTGFTGLFLATGILQHWLGGLATLLLLAWLGWNIYQAYSSPQGAATAAGAAQGLSFTLRTTSGPNVRLGNPFRGTFIAGGAGSGKSKSIIEPILQQAGALGLTGVVALVKSLVQRLNERAGWGLPLEGKKGLHIKAERVFEGIIREIEFPMQVDVLPAYGRAGGDGIGHLLALVRRGLE